MSGVSPTYYLDTSALLPYYREEATTRSIQEFLSSLSGPVLISDLTEVEFASALSRLVRTDELTEAHASLVENAFEGDIRSGLFLRLSLIRRNFRQAKAWLSTRRTALRTLDALHLSCSVEAEVTMVTCDAILAEAAVELGISCRLLRYRE